MQMSKVRGHKSVALGAKWPHFVRPVGLGFCFVFLFKLNELPHETLYFQIFGK